MSSSFDIVIAHRGPGLGLWATICSCEQALEKSKWDYRYFLVSNGNGKDNEEKEAFDLMLEHLTKTGKVGGVLENEAPLSPPTARNLGAKMGNAPAIFYLDNHVLVQPNYFDRGMAAMFEHGCESVHSATRYFIGGPTAFFYRLQYEKSMWAYSVTEAPGGILRIASAGHGGWAVKRDVWEKVGGYWDGFTGYAGEETYFDMKLALLDIPNYMDTGMVHHHSPGVRNYERENGVEAKLNLLCCANIIGGERWLERVKNSFKIEQVKRPLVCPNLDLEALALEAYGKSYGHAKWLDGIRKRSLNAQLVKFQRDKVWM